MLRYWKRKIADNYDKFENQFVFEIHGEVLSIIHRVGSADLRISKDNDSQQDVNAVIKRSSLELEIVDRRDCDPCHHVAS